MSVMISHCFELGLRCQDQQSACGDKQCDVHVLPLSDLHRVTAGYHYTLSLPEADCANRNHTLSSVVTESTIMFVIPCKLVIF